MIRADLQHRTGQQLAMTPQLQHSIRLLQLSAAEFEQELEETLSNNPFLERDDSLRESGTEAVSSGDAGDGQSVDTQGEAAPEAAGDRLDVIAAPESSAADWDDESSLRFDAPSSGERSTDDPDATHFAPAASCMYDHLLEQLGVCRVSARDRELARLVVHALEPDGYLRTPLEELIAMCPAREAVQVDELSVVLRLVQSFEPAGIAARSLEECLLLQLGDRDEDTPGLALAQRIVRGHLAQLATPDTPRLLRALGCSDAEFASAYQLIRGCSPRPGQAFGSERTDYVVADVQVRKIGKRWVARINPEVVPRIHLNRGFVSMVREQRGSSSSPIGQHLQEARWFVRNVNQRFRTILRVAQAIVDRQSRYFEHGDIAMRPLVLREIAETLGMHESTVSRVTSNKYMMTTRGLMELKYFFSSHVESDGHACSARAVRALIRQILVSEEARHPLSDVKVARLLAEKGIVVARRTVSKYRDSMHIPSVEVRRLSSSEALAA
ncbi:MAG: RNA polymerase factor sigma-54 [bacterium]|jgi:RNA polymerase sigma-54 factor|nr:RNA polymerase factor sigma-54 [Betaproteobacteria bacterium]